MTNGDSKVASNGAKVWTLAGSDMADDDVDLIDPDELLDADDFAKPNPESLKGKV